MTASAVILLFCLALPRIDYGTRASDRVRLMRHPKPGVRMRAAMLLAYAPKDRAIAALLIGLSDPAQVVRRESAHSVRILGDERAVPFLARRIRAETVASVLVELLAALGATGGTYAARDVAPLLDHPHRDVRAAAVLALGRLGDSGQRDALWAALRYAPDDPGFQVRCAVLGAFVNLGWKEDAARALDELVKLGVLRHWFGRAAVLSAVGMAGMKERLPWVRTMLEDSEDPRVVAAGMETLARLGAADEVVERVRDRSPTVRRAALAALQEVGDPRAVQLARDRLRDRSEQADVRFEGALVLAAANAPDADVYLVDALRSNQPVFWITALSELERRHGRSFGRDPDAWSDWLKRKSSSSR